MNQDPAFGFGFQKRVDTMEASWSTGWAQRHLDEPEDLGALGSCNTGLGWAGGLRGCGHIPAPTAQAALGAHAGPARGKSRLEDVWHLPANPQELGLGHQTEGRAPRTGWGGCWGVPSLSTQERFTVVQEGPGGRSEWMRGSAGWGWTLRPR